MNFDLQARDGANVQVGDAHGRKVAVDGLDRQAEGAQATALGERVRDHVVLVQGHKYATTRGADDRFVRGTVVAFVTINPGAIGQLKGEFVDRREIVESARQEGEGDRQPVRRAHQMQPPAEELLLLGRAVATVGAPAHRPAAPCAPALAHGDRHAVDDKVGDGGLAVSEQVAPHVEQQGQPIGQGVNAPREAGRGQRMGQVARRPQDGEGALVVVPEERRRHHCHGQHLRIAHPGQVVARVPQGAHRLLDHHINAYNMLGGHRPSPFHCCLSTTVKRMLAMIAN